MRVFRLTVAAALLLASALPVLAQDKKKTTGSNPWGIDTSICCTAAHLDAMGKAQADMYSAQRYTPEGYAKHGPPAIVMPVAPSMSCTWVGPRGGTGTLRHLESSPGCAPIRHMGQ